MAAKRPRSSIAAASASAAELDELEKSQPCAGLPDPLSAPRLPARKKARRRVATQGVADPERSANEAPADQISVSWKLEPGVILLLRLKNFMCHGDLTYNPSERLNFLSGVNGSGKSAVLSAVVFALGGSARTSNRGSANRDLVRSGHGMASVEIRLFNGSDPESAYRPDVYGQTVTVIRTVKREGGGAYKFLNHAGKPVHVQKPREELDKMLCQFCIQVDNPIAILNQDNAKTFLADSNPGRLYDFFMRATLLEDCKRELDAATEEKVRAEELLTEREDDVPALQQEMDRWSRKMEQLQGRRDRERAIARKKAELMWALEGKAQRMAEDVREKILRIDKKVQICEREMEKAVDEANRLKQEKEEAEKDVQDKASKAEERQRAVNELRKNFNEAALAERKIKRCVDAVVLEQSRTAQTVKMLEETIAKNRDKGEHQEEEKRRTEEIEKLEGEVRQRTAEMETQQVHQTNLSRSLDSMREEKRKIQAEKQGIRNEKDSIVKRLDGLRNTQGQRYAAFGEQMERLMSAMDREAKRFKKFPLGPVGAMITLKSGVTERQQVLLESDLGQLMRTFIVDNFDDQKALRTIQQKVNAHFPIITASFSNSPYNVSSGRCRHRFPAIMDLLEVKDATVFNCLVDHKDIDRILVIPSDREAQQLLSLSDTVPLNCLYALTEEGSQFYPDPNYRSYQFALNDRRLLNVNQTEIIKELEKEVKEVECKLGQFEPRERELTGRWRFSQEEYDKSVEDVRRLQEEIKRRNLRVGELKNKAAEEKSVSVAALEEDLDREREKLTEADQNVEREQKRLDEQKEATERAKNVFEARKEEMETQFGSDACKDKLEEIVNKIRTAVSNRKYYSNKREEIKTSKACVEKDLREKELRHAEVLEKAKRMSPERPETAEGISVAELEQQLKTMQAMAKESDRILEPFAVVKENLTRVSKRFTTASRETRWLRERVVELAAMLAQREEGYKKIRRSVAKTVDFNFMVCLHTRRYRGSLQFSHEERRLFIQVDPEGGGDDGRMASRGMKTMSGGEKSYSTISLILALWQVMASPFRLLDEFDVFMDALNRRLAVEQIRDYAVRNRRHQFILLTPLDLHGIPVDDDLQITKLEKSADQ